MIRQSSETLAGRISYLELTPFLYRECAGSGVTDLNSYWLRGGYPRSLLSTDAPASFIWRSDFIRTFIERDVLQLKDGISSSTVERLLTMCAHVQGRTINYCALGSSLDLSDNTIRHYLDLLNGAFLIRILRPFHKNLKKRLVKAPKVYLRDSGILHALLTIESMDNLLGHPSFGASWEGMVIENILSCLKPGVNPTYYRSAKGEEVDLVLEYGTRYYAIECKAGMRPDISKSMRVALNDIAPEHTWIVAPVTEQYPLAADVTVVPLLSLYDDPRLKDLFCW